MMIFHDHGYLDQNGEDYDQKSECVDYFSESDLKVFPPPGYDMFRTHPQLDLQEGSEGLEELLEDDLRVKSIDRIP